MIICVLGLWHLDTVTAACLAALGRRVVGLSRNEQVVANLNAAVAPVFGPRLDALLREGMASGKLRLSTMAGQATAGGRPAIRRLHEGAARGRRGRPSQLFATGMAR
jgi:UDPglucose 6-dehydrogenase